MDSELKHLTESPSANHYSLIICFELISIPIFLLPIVVVTLSFYWQHKEEEEDRERGQEEPGEKEDSDSWAKKEFFKIPTN